MIIVVRKLFAALVLAALCLLPLPAAAQMLLLGYGSGAGCTSSYVGPNDQVAGITHFYGLRGASKCSANGATKALNIRRASDNATSDIVITTSGDLDVTTASTFCNATTCFAATIYDQIGSANATQGTAANQPQLTFNCLNTTKPCLTFASASSQRLTATISTSAQPNTFSFVAERTVTGSTTNTVIGGNNSEQAGLGTAAGKAFVFAGSNATATAADNTLHAVQGVANGASSSLNVDGTLTGSLSAGSNSLASTLQIGESGASGNPFQGLFAEAFYYAGVAQSSGNQALLCANQRAYWGSAGSC